MPPSAGYNQQRKRVASNSPMNANNERPRRKSRIVVDLCDSDDEVKVYEIEGSVVEEPEVIDLCESEDDASEVEEVGDEVEEGWEGVPDLSSALADLHGKEIDDEIYPEPGSPDLTRDQTLSGESDDEPDPGIQSPKSSPKEIRQEALAILKERRKVSQARPRGVKREDTGLRRKFRKPTPNSDGVEVYSSEEEEATLPREPFIPAPPKKGTGKRFIWIYRSGVS